MNSNRRTYRCILSNLKQLYPSRLTGRQLQHLNVLAGMMTGIVRSQSSHLEKIARKIPTKTQIESRIKRCTRFNQNSNIDADTFFIPFIQPLITSLASSGTVTLAMDGSETGNKCMTLLVSIIYRQRAIPIAWLTVKGNKGHLSEDIHLELFEQVRHLFPDNCSIVFLGDGEFDGQRLQQAIIDTGWEYVCRTACNRIIIDGDDKFSLSEVGIAPGESVDIPNVGFTQANYPVELVIIWWRKGNDAPIYLVSNMECVAEACQWYRRRFCIETFFSDQKSRGFNLQKSHLSDPERITRFMIATCLAYIWMIYLGVKVREKEPEMKMIHRTDRCDLSLFQLGIRYLEYLLDFDLEIPFSLKLPA